MLQSSPHTQSAWTLLETVIASAVAMSILAAIVLGGAVFQKTFNGSYYSFQYGADQSRVLDYISRDLRMGLNGNVSNSGKRLAVNIPIYTSGTASGIPDPARGSTLAPVLKNGKVAYSSTTLAITYSTLATGAIQRLSATASGSSSIIIASAGAGWSLAFSDPNDISHPTKDFSFGGASGITSVKTTFSFSSTFGYVTGGTGSVAYDVTSLRTPQ